MIEVGSRRAAIGAVLLVLSVFACFPFSGGEHAVDGPYRLFATDAPEEMQLVYMLDGGAFVSRIGATVFAVGWDARHVIAKRHPRNDRHRTEYFILDRSLDAPATEPAVSVRGPYTEAEFAAARRSLGVAASLEFTLVLEGLQ